MKKLPALAATMLVAALCLSACTPAGDDNVRATAPISLSPGSFPAQGSAASPVVASGAALGLQAFFTAVDDETGALKVDIATLDYEQLKESFPRSMRRIDEDAVGEENVERLIREYSKNITSIPNKGYISIDPKALQASNDGSVVVNGKDLFMVYKEGTKYITHVGASMASTDSLNDVFTMDRSGGSWKITDIRF